MAGSAPLQTPQADLLHDGREALLAGDKTRAQSLLLAAVEHDPHSEEAWMWLSGTYTTPDDMAHCLEQVLAINPHNEQAREGLRWIEQQYGLVLDHQEPAPTPPVTPTVLRPTPPAHGAFALLEAALHPFAIGALFGLMRLAGWVRPSSLVLLRSDAGPMSFANALGVALASGLLHGLAVLLAWLVAGLLLSRWRAHDRGDRFDSLLRAGHLWLPGYLWAGALALLLIGTRLGAGLGAALNTLAWLVAGAGAVWIIVRLWREMRGLGVPLDRKQLPAARVVVAVLATAGLGLTAAGLIATSLLG